MKTLIAVLFLCAGVYSQDIYTASQLDSVILSANQRLFIEMLADSMVYNTDYVSPEELVEGLEIALSYTREGISTTLEYMSPAERLRDMANQIEKRESDLLRLQILLDKAKRYYSLKP